MFGRPTETAQLLMQERGITTCEVDGCDRPGVQGHHCLYRKDKRYPELNVSENFQLVCYICHHVTGAADSWENRLRFWGLQCDRFGHDHMVAWHNALPLKVKEHGYK